MILKLVNILFGRVVGRLPEEKKKLYWSEFKDLLAKIAKESVKGAVEGKKK